jgi:hypothetical protein
MKEIPLTKGKVALVDDDVFEFLNQWKWFYSKGPEDRTGYAIRFDKNGKHNKSISMHRVIMNTPPNLEVDHRDRDGCNNQRLNMRNCSHFQNVRNRSIQKDNSSGYKGVSWDKKCKKWRVQIRIDGRKVWLGLFSSIQDASRIYDQAAIRFHGEFANINGA